MGIFDKPTPKPVSAEQTIEIHLPTRPPEETVTARISVHDTDMAWVAARLKRVLSAQRKMSMAAQLKLADRLCLHLLIVSWGLTKNGEIIPLDPDLESDARYQAIRALDQNEQDIIYAHIMKAQPEQRELGGRPRINPDLQRAIQSRGKR